LELLFEARYGPLIKQKEHLEEETKRLTKQNTEYEDRIDRVRVVNESLKEQLLDSENKLASFMANGDAAAMIKEMHADINHRDDHIAKEKLRAEIESLKRLEAQNVQLEDELNVAKKQLFTMTGENAALAKRANTADHYQRKLETTAHYELENRELIDTNEMLRENLKDYEMMKIQNKTLQKTDLEYQDMLTKRELEIQEYLEQKRRLIEDRQEFQQRIILLESDNRQLQERLEGPDDSPTVISPKNLASLGDELEESAGRDTVEMQSLRAQIDVLRQNSTAVQDNVDLRQELENAVKREKQLATKCNSLFEKLAIAEQQVSAILNASTTEGLVKGVDSAMLIGELNMLTPEYYRTKAYSDLHDAHKIATEALVTLEKKYTDTQAELEDARRELVEAKNDRKLCAHILMNLADRK